MILGVSLKFIVVKLGRKPFWILFDGAVYREQVQNLQETLFPFVLLILSCGLVFSFPQDGVSSLSWLLCFIWSYLKYPFPYCRSSLSSFLLTRIGSIERFSLLMKILFSFYWSSRLSSHTYKDTFVLILLFFKVCNYYQE